MIGTDPGGTVDLGNTDHGIRVAGATGTTIGGPKMWQELAPGYNSEPVDCLADYGVHGDGRDGLFWPMAGSDLVDWYTNDPAQAITFGSAPANVTYDVYDGNYINYLAGTGSTASVTMSRSDIMKATDLLVESGEVDPRREGRAEDRVDDPVGLFLVLLREDSVVGIRHRRPEHRIDELREALRQPGEARDRVVVEVEPAQLGRADTVVGDHAAKKRRNNASGGGGGGAALRASM